MDDNFLVSLRWGDALAGGTMINGATKGVCSKCGETISISPSSVEYLASAKDAKLLCLQCALPIIQSDESPELGIVPGALTEVAQHRKILEQN